MYGNIGVAVSLVDQVWVAMAEIGVAVSQMEVLTLTLLDIVFKTPSQDKYNCIYYH